MELDFSGWELFTVGSLFDIKYGVNLELNACIESDSDDAINFVSRTESNNGVSARIERIEGLEPQKAGLITVATGGSVLSTFVQPEPFYSGRDLYILDLKEDSADELVKFFLVSMIEANKFKFSYGRQANKSLPYIELLLPVQRDSAGAPVIDLKKNYRGDGHVPDWQFMECYIRNLNHKPITTQIKSGQAPDLNIASWEEFVVRDIFEIYNGKGITTEEVAENPGTLNAVQSGELTNGVIGRIDVDYCRSMDYTFTEQQCLSVARTGTAGFVAYQADGCVVGDSAKLLILRKENASRETYMFLRTVLEHNRFKYSYGRKVTEKKYLSDVLDLPIAVHADGKPIIDSKRTFHADGYIPDWQFMEDYIKALPYSDRIGAI